MAGQVPEWPGRTLIVLFPRRLLFFYIVPRLGNRVLHSQGQSSLLSEAPRQRQSISCKMLPHELKTLEPSSPQELGGSVSSKDIDEIHLARLGKRPVLKVI